MKDFFEKEEDRPVENKTYEEIIQDLPKSGEKPPTLVVGM